MPLMEPPVRYNHRMDAERYELAPFDEDRILRSPPFGATRIRRPPVTSRIAALCDNPTTSARRHRHTGTRVKAAAASVTVAPACGIQGLV